MTEKRKMLTGEMYLATDPELVAERMRARQILQRFNSSDVDDPHRRRALLDELLGGHAKNYVIEPPFQCDYGYNIIVGENFFANFNCVFLDVMRIEIGRNVMFGPAVQLYTATHPLDVAERNSGREFGKPITIGDNVWIGGAAIVLPGVTIGSGTTIGAGSVVTRDVPAGVLAVGNPCRVVRTLS
jgi:maltose O-acetyltransferase